MTPKIVTAGAELFIWMAFIIFTMVAQAIKGVKNFKENRPQQDDSVRPPGETTVRQRRESGPSVKPDSAPRPHLDPQQELEQFLRNLAGGNASKASPKAAEPKAAAPKSAPRPSASKSSAPKATASRSTRLAPPSLPHMASRHAKAKHAKSPRVSPSAPMPVETPAPQLAAAARIHEMARANDTNYDVVDHDSKRIATRREQRLALGAMLANKQSLRKAILLKEILGPPIAMRDGARNQTPGG